MSDRVNTVMQRPITVIKSNTKLSANAKMRIMNIFAQNIKSKKINQLFIQIHRCNRYDDLMQNGNEKHKSKHLN